MSEVAGALGRRLTDLRTRAFGRQLTKAELAGALGVTTTTITNWESGKALPVEHRLHDLAAFYALGDPQGRPKGRSELTRDQERRREDLVNELVALRDHEVPAPEPHPMDGRTTAATAGLGTFWAFGDTLDIHILCTPMTPGRLNDPDYANPWHPNHLGLLDNGDMDALVEVFGHIRACNPQSDVRFRTLADPVRSDHLTGHVVVLGAGDFLGYDADAEDVGAPDDGTALDLLRYFLNRLEIPVGTRLPEGEDPEFGHEFVVTVDADGAPGWRGQASRVHTPRFEVDDGAPRRPVLRNGYPQLTYDVALLARQPSPLNTTATVTICSGIFSRGTLGAVRALTDKYLRGPNEQVLRRTFGSLSRFWQLIQVPVVGTATVTPDLRRPFLRLEGSAQAD